MKEQICLTLKVSEKISLVCLQAFVWKNKIFTAYARKKMREWWRKLMEGVLKQHSTFFLFYGTIELSFYVYHEQQKSAVFLSIHNITNLLLLIHS